MTELEKSENLFNRWGGRKAAFFGYTHLAHDMCIGLLPAMLPLIRTTLGLNYFQSSLLLSSFSITFGFSQFPGGWLGDRIDPYRAAGIGLGGIGLTTVMVGLPSTYHLLLVLMVVMGLFAGPYHPSATSIISDLFEREFRGKAIALHLVGGSIGFTLGPVFGGILTELFGWRSAFIFLGLPSLVASFMVFQKGFQTGTVDLGVSNGTSTSGRDMTVPSKMKKDVFRILRPIIIIASLAILVQLVAGCATAFIAIYLVDKHKVVPAFSSIFLGVLRAGGIAGSFLGGWLSDYWNRRNAILLPLISIGPVLYLITILPFNPFFIVIFFVFGLLVYMMQATVQPLIMDTCPQEFRSTVFGIYFGLSMEGMSLLQPVAGHFMDKVGIIDVFHIIALISCIFSVMALWLISNARYDRS
ncbi:MAG: MFS transporter [Deltaproteobacteria bacterium]|nr:MFS transporter [Deltaproteobacteria bacterium]